MFLSGMGGSGKSEVIKAFIHFAENISFLFNWNYDIDTIKISALTGAAACQLPNGKTLHSVAYLSNTKLTREHRQSWKSTIILIIDEVSFLDEHNLMKLDKHLKILKENNQLLYGGIQIIFVGDFFQMLPVRGSPLFKNTTIQFNAINKAVFLNTCHRFKNDEEYGMIMRRLRIGRITTDDIHKINTRYIKNPDVSLPSISKLRCACYRNDERNAFNNLIFLQHLKTTHHLNHETDKHVPTHTCIIKANMRYSGKKGTPLNLNLYNRLLDECGDCDITNGSKAFVDPALKFFHGIPLMMNTNERISENLANGTPCYGLYVKLKEGTDFIKENWEGYMVNTIYATDIEYILCSYEHDQQKFFKIKPETRQCQIRLPMCNKIKVDDISVTYLPVNSSISTTGHKLQGKTLEHLVINSWAYGCTHWVYVVLSRVMELSCLILNELLDIHRNYEPKQELIKWENHIKKTIEKKTFQARGKSDYDKYIQEEIDYNSLL